LQSYFGDIHGCTTPLSLAQVQKRTWPFGDLFKIDRALTWSKAFSLVNRKLEHRLQLRSLEVLSGVQPSTTNAVF
jgi:hypothetical protein